MITRLKFAMDASGYKQDHIAKKIGIDYTLLSRYAHGARSVPPGVLRAIAKLLKVPVASLKGEVK
jgi:transcriptional regulator with XRE-family HTH domain